jgi:hypothetical protein
MVERLSCVLWSVPVYIGGANNKEGMQLPEKYRENFDVSSEDPSPGS